MTALEIYPFRLRFRSQGGDRRYTGSAWRGALGYHLRRLVCLCPHSDCATCPLNPHCAWVLLFDPNLPHGGGDRPVPYALCPQWQDEGQDVYLTLFGRQAATQFPYMLQALKQAAGDVAGRRFHLLALEHWQGSGWQPLQGQPAPLPDVELSSPPSALRVRMQTPLRCKAQGRLVGRRDISLDLWRKTLRRRLLELAADFGDLPRMQALCEPRPEDDWQDAYWRWQEFGRHSRRQHADMKMGGLSGSFTLNQEQTRALWPMLRLGQWTHLGKTTSMGLGKYTLEVAG